MKSIRLKPIRRQVVVVIGASSGIGRLAASKFARAGARVVVVARGASALESLVAEIAQSGGVARAIVCDVTDADGLRAVAAAAESWFGRVDTWVHCASVLHVGAFAEIDPRELLRVLDINVVGAVRSAQAALPVLRRAGSGALIVVSSAEAYLAMPLHTAYGASKHAVEGAFGALRRELMAQRVPISVTLVRPAAVDTPVYLNARNLAPAGASAPPPSYDPAVVAACILRAAAHPVRLLYAGGAARTMAACQAVAPATVDRIMAKWGSAFMTSKSHRGLTAGNLYAPSQDGRVRTGIPRRGRRWSLYTAAQLHPWPARLTATAVIGSVLLRRRRLR